MKRKIQMHSVGAAALALIMGTGIVSAPLAASASEEGTRNTTLGLGAAAAALLLTQKNKLPGAIVGAGALYTGYKLQQDIKKRHDRERQYGYNNYNNRYNNRSTGQYSSNRRVQHSAELHRRYVNQNAAHHDNGLHNGWTKNGHDYRRDDR